MTGGFARTCPLCGFTGAFMAHPRSGRQNATCPQCKARERHRMLALYFAGPGASAIAGKRVLHFSPEDILGRFLGEAADYKTADPTMAGVDLRLDITCIDLPDASVDAILCNHVLEHVEDDKSAFAELYRVLAPGGVAIITIPVIEGWETTYEDPAIDTPELRELHFGRHDHVRYYGRDVRARIRAAGFELEIFQPSPADCVTYAIHRGHSVFLAQKR
jgi:SAM-dependent methyltransferase